MGILHLDREEFDKAAVSIRQALTINKTYPLALSIMGNILFQSGNPEQSIKYYTQALKFEKADL
jgi:tetratricopeptide (TPR) repeat protein